MSYTLYQSSVPGFIAMLGNIKNWLDKAAAQKDEAVLIEAKLAPDMFALARQVQIVSDTAKGAAARLIGFSRLDFSSVFFVNSGAEANENALKMAFTVTRRSEVVALEHGFHGRTAAAA